ncbi:ATP-dependent helicase [Paludibacter sp. 221]|uniref:DEAD/DEAH box helicase n=1 Tax=Paludibacter sp. 221 TaxID=2302939 RepID=UPI0013CFE3F0|nr:DEAD/DEAH box helicase [Paludibacter sp. 221]NDV47006.1 ATP-dependent helicase [Paludibacter sp. 221]
MTFKELNLKGEILSAIEELGYEQPMPVQEKTIPFVLEQQADLVALAQTGTGKTAAFGLPILNTIDVSRKQVQALVLSPTRELCIQIAKDLKNYSKNMRGLRVVAVYGGEDIRTQLRQLDETPQIIVATPGRLIDLIERGKVALNNIDFLVLDEADEMLNMGFKEDIKTILEKTPETRRTLLFSATMPKEIANIARQYMKNFEEITIGTRNSGSENVEHIYYISLAKQRYLVLKRIVDLNPDIYGIVFCRTRQETKEVAEKLMQDGYNADALHGDLSQAQRDTVMQKFRIRNIQLLVATDVAARGLDVSDLTHVINYNLPDDTEVYTHRSGRTGRANKSGISVSIIHSKEKFKIKDLERMLKKSFKQLPIPNGLEVCKKQLFHLIDRMQQVEVNEEQIAPYMEQIMKQLEYLEKEEILKRFVSLEFNRFLEYYKNADDLNVVEQSRDRGERGERGSERGKRGTKTGEKTRLKMNMGNQEGITPRRLLGIINDFTNDKSISIGSIEVTNKFTFFDVYSDQVKQLLNAFSNQSEVVVVEAKGSRSYDDRRPAKRNTQGSWGERSRGDRKRTHYGNESANQDKPWRKGRERSNVGSRKK